MGAFTHYIPAFTERNGRQERAVCGTWIDSRSHSAEPACPVCAEWLRRDADELEDTADGLGLKLENGMLVPR